MKQKLQPKDWHAEHEQELVIGDFGPHCGKWICKKCKGKWVRWANKKEVKNAKTVSAS